LKVSVSEIVTVPPLVVVLSTVPVLVVVSTEVVLIVVVAVCVVTSEELMVELAVE
jgi:hypothetical protein